MWSFSTTFYPQKSLSIHGLQAARYKRYAFVWETQNCCIVNGFRCPVSSCVYGLQISSMLSDCSVLPATCLAACRKGIVAEDPGCCLLSSSKINCRSASRSLKGKLLMCKATHDDRQKHIRSYMCALPGRHILFHLATKGEHNGWCKGKSESQKITQEDTQLLSLAVQ